MLMTVRIHSNAGRVVLELEKRGHQDSQNRHGLKTHETLSRPSCLTTRESEAETSLSKTTTRRPPRRRRRDLPGLLQPLVRPPSRPDLGSQAALDNPILQVRA